MITLVFIYYFPKDLFVKQVKLDYVLNHKSLEHNTQVIRALLKEWAQTSIILGKKIPKKERQKTWSL